MAVSALSICRKLVSCFVGVAILSIVFSISTFDSFVEVFLRISPTTPFSKRVFLVDVIFRAASNATVSTEKLSGSEIALCRSSIISPIATTLAGFLLILPCSKLISAFNKEITFWSSCASRPTGTPSTVLTPKALVSRTSSDRFTGVPWSSTPLTIDMSRLPRAKSSFIWDSFSLDCAFSNASSDLFKLGFSTGCLDNSSSFARAPVSFWLTALSLRITVVSSIVWPVGICFSSASSLATSARAATTFGSLNSARPSWDRFSLATSSSLCRSATIDSWFLTIRFCFAAFSASGPPPLVSCFTISSRPESFQSHLLWFSASPAFKSACFAAKCSPMGTPSISISGPLSVPSGSTYGLVFGTSNPRMLFHKISSYLSISVYDASSSRRIVRLNAKRSSSLIFSGACFL